MLRPHLAGAVAAALLAVSAAACSRKGPECQSIVKIINPAAEKLKAAGSSKSDKLEDQAKAIETIGQTVERAAEDLGKLRITTPELQKLSADYQAMSKGAAAGAREMAQAIEVTQGAVKAQEKAGKDLEDAMTKWSAACIGPKDPKDRDACLRFAAELKKLPEDPAKTADIDKGVADLEKIELHADDVKAAGKALVAALRAQTKVMVDIEGAKTKAEAAEKKFDEAEGKEGKIIDELNRFCQG